MIGIFLCIALAIAWRSDVIDRLTTSLFFSGLTKEKTPTWIRWQFIIELIFIFDVIDYKFHGKITEHCHTVMLKRFSQSIARMWQSSFKIYFTIGQILCIPHHYITCCCYYSTVRNSEKFIWFAILHPCLIASNFLFIIVCVKLRSSLSLTVTETIFWFIPKINLIDQMR